MLVMNAYIFSLDRYVPHVEFNILGIGHQFEFFDSGVKATKWYLFTETFSQPKISWNDTDTTNL